MFSEDFKIDPEQIKVLKNLSKKEILSEIETLVKDVKQFRQDNKDDSHSVKSIFFSWVGFHLKPDLHPYMGDFDIDYNQFPHIWQLTA